MGRSWKVLVGMLLASSAMAAEPVRIDPALDLQRQQQEQRLQQQLTVPRPALAPVTPPPSAAKSSAGCVPVRQVEVQGVTALAPEDLAGITAAYEGRCLAQADISQLMQGINAAYVARGFITSRAYLPEQTVAAGVLRLQVIEGVVEALLLNGHQDGVAGRRIAAAFPTRAGKKLRLQDIEQGVDQVNRAPSAQAAVALEPGEQPGGTKVLVKTLDERSWRAGLYGDNGGEAATGRLKFTATVDKDNLFEVNDSWQLAFSRSERSRAFSLSPVLPFGYWTFNASYSRSDYENPL
ncbi:MAG TPA: POTRA domain-containing protein, partial [Moraxellaceae bacterium]